MIRDVLASQCGPDRLDPPAAVIRGIVVSDLTGNKHPTEWDGLVDTGADVTLVPQQICDSLGLPATDAIHVGGFDGAAGEILRDVYWVRLEIRGAGSVPVRGIGVDSPHLLLGRDFLSHFLVLYDGTRSSLAFARPTLIRRLVSGLLRYC